LERKENDTMDKLIKRTTTVETFAVEDKDRDLSGDDRDDDDIDGVDDDEGDEDNAAARKARRK
jgi:hypothetical protein